MTSRRSVARRISTLPPVPGTLAEEFTFPVLTPAELEKDLAKYFPELGVKQEHLLNPGGDWTSRVYEAFLRKIGKWSSSDDYFPPVFHGPTHVDAGNIEEDTLRKMRLYSVLRRVLPKIQIKNFCMDNLVNPSKQNTIKIFSGLVNYLMYQEERLVVHERAHQELVNKLSVQRHHERELGLTRSQKDQLIDKLGESAKQEAERKEENSMLKKIFDGRKSEIRKKESLKQAIILETQNQEQEFAKLQKTFEDEKIELEAAKKSVVKDAEWICKEVQKEEERVRVAEEKLNMCKAQTKAAENESLRMTELSEGVKLMQKRLEDYAEILKKTKEEEGLERESIMQLDSLKELIAEVHLVLDQRQEEIEELQSRKTTLKQEMESIRTDADKDDGAGVGVDSKAHSLRNLRQRVDHLETGTKALDRKKNFLEMQDKDAVDYWKKLLADLQKQRKAALQAYLKEGEAINKEIEDIMSRLREERDLLRFRKNGKESRSGGSQ